MNISKPNISRSEKASHPHHRSSAILDWCDSGFHWDHSSSLELVSYTWLEENKNGYILCNPIYFPFVTISSYWSICRGRICEMTSEEFSELKVIIQNSNIPEKRLRGSYKLRKHGCGVGEISAVMFILGVIGCFRPQKTSNPFSHVTQRGAILGGFLDVCWKFAVNRRFY